MKKLSAYEKRREVLEREGMSTSDAQAVIDAEGIKTLFERLTIVAVKKNDEEEVRIDRRECKGQAYYDLRLWFRTSTDGEWRPTRKGLTLSEEVFLKLLSEFGKRGNKK